MRNPNNAPYRILLDQLIGCSGLNAMLNIAVAAEPDRGITYTKVAASFLAPWPLALVLLVGIFCFQNPPETIKILSILGSDCMQMNIF